MNILIISTGNYPHIGGKSSHIESLVKGFSVSGVTSEVVSYSDFSIFEKIILGGVKGLLLPIKHLRYPLYVWKINHLSYKMLKRCIRKKTLEMKYDCLVAEDPSAALIAKDFLDESIPLFLTMHSYFGKSMGAMGDGKYQLNQEYLNKERDEHLQCLDYITALVAVDNRIMEDCAEYIENLNAKCKLYTVANFVDTELYKPTSDQAHKDKIKQKYDIPQNRKIIVCIRRLCEKNGVIYAVKAMKHLSEDYLLVIGGSGECLVEIETYIKEEHLESKVKLLGAIDAESSREIYAISDFSVVPSITYNGLQEATSISALEAMSFGIPTIASSIGGLKQMICDKENGMLVSECEPKEIANGIMALSLNTDLYDSVSIKGREDVVNNYSHIAGAKKYLDIYTEFM